MTVTSIKKGNGFETRRVGGTIIRASLQVLLFLIFYNQAVANTDSLLQRADALATKDFSASIELCERGIRLSTDIQDKAIFYRIQGKAYYFKGDFKAASILYSKAINILETGDRPKELGLTFIEQAKLYRKTNLLYAAEKAYGRALNIFTTLKDSLNISTVLNESGVVYEYKGDFDKAIQLYEQSWHLKKALKDTIGMAYAYNFMAGAYLQQNKLFDAHDYAQKALSLFSAKKDSFAVALGLSDLAKISLQAAKFSEAKNYLTNSNKYAGLIKYPDLLANNYQLFSEIHKREGRLDSALIDYKRFSEIKDSLYTAGMQQTMLELNAKYETSQKDKEIAKRQSALKMKNMQLAVSVGSAVLLLLLFFTTYRGARLKHRNVLQNTIIQYQDMATKSIIEAEESERQRMSSTLHDGLGQLLSAAKMNIQSLEQSIVQEVPAIQTYQKAISLLDESISEMRNVSHQMMPGAVVRFGLGKALKDLIEQINSQKLQINLNVEGLNENYDQNIQIVVFRIFQECINNVIKHSGANKLFISLIQTENYIDATIEDNGMGFDPDHQSNKTGIGLENIKTRINFLKGILDISSGKGKGTLIAFHIPLK